MESGRRALPCVGSLAVLIWVLFTAACGGGGVVPSPSPRAGATAHLFTVMTTDRILTADPAAAVDQGSMILVENVFQRLTMSAPGQSELAPGVWALKPDLAQECLFTSREVFTCTLRPKLMFSNGDPITSADVKFSIERAIRLGVNGSSASALASLRRIETPDPMTVRFVLGRYDRQFGWALAGPAASIVDAKVYDPDGLQRNDDRIVGSGPFKVAAFDRQQLILTRFDHYLGRTPGQLSQLRVVTEPDSATVEAAMYAHQTDMVWRGLSADARARWNTIGPSASRTPLLPTSFRSRRLAGSESWCCLVRE